MSAGLLTYRLCDRDFDCDACPLDAALRGEPGDRALVDARLRAGGGGFPDDRLYAAGHTWVRPRAESGGSTVLVGLDALAAGLAGACLEVDGGAVPRTVRAGEGLCELHLDAGLLPLAAPVSGRVVRANDALRSAPDLVVTDPYAAGWLVEMESSAPLEEAGLCDGGIASERSRRDVRRFHRVAALTLLASTPRVGACLADGGERLTDLRQVLGARRFVALLREVVH